MKKFFKFLSVALLATTVCVSLASCGEENGDDSATEQGGGGEGEGGGEGGGGSVTIPDGITVKLGDATAWTPGADTTVYNNSIFSFYYQTPAAQRTEDAYGDFLCLGGLPTADGEYNVADMTSALAKFYYCENGAGYKITPTGGSQFFTGTWAYAGENAGNIIMEGVNVNGATMKVTYKVTIPFVDVKALVDQADQVPIKNLVVSVGNANLYQIPSKKMMAPKPVKTIVR